MKRKVVQHGPATLTVSLPSEWVKRHKVQKGTELSIELKDQNLIISPSENIEHEKISLNLSNLDKTYAKCIIHSAYRKGFDTIKIKFSNPELYHIRTGTYQNTKDIIINETDQLIGFEVVNINRDEIEIANLTYDKSTDFNIMLNNVYSYLLDFYQYIYETIEQKNALDLSIIEKKHRLTEKLNNYCLRLLNKKETLPPRDERIYYHIISSIDFINNTVKYFARDGLGTTTDLNQNSKNFCGQIYNYLILFINLCKNFNTNNVSQIAKKRREIRENLKGLADSIPENELLILAELKQVVEASYHLTEALFELQHQ